MYAKDWYDGVGGGRFDVPEDGVIEFTVTDHEIDICFTVRVTGLAIADAEEDDGNLTFTGNKEFRRRLREAGL